MWFDSKVYCWLFLGKWIFSSVARTMTHYEILKYCIISDMNCNKLPELNPSFIHWVSWISSKLFTPLLLVKPNHLILECSVNIQNSFFLILFPFRRYLSILIKFSQKPYQIWHSHLFAQHLRLAYSVNIQSSFFFPLIFYH